MDILDIKILREVSRSEPFGHMLYNPRIPLSQVARKLGVDSDTVRNRLKKLKDSGFLRGWVAFVNPGLFGLRETRLRFEIPVHSSKDDLVRKLKLVPGMTTIASLFGNSIIVGLLYESEQLLKKSIELISSVSDAENILRFDNVLPECKMKLSKTDWDIIRSLQRDPRKSYSLVSKELSRSSRTVKRRLERLIEGKAISAVMSVDLSSADGTLVSLLVVYTSPEHQGEVNERIISYLDDCMFRAELADKNHGFFNLVISNVARVQEISHWIKEQPGVSSYRVDLVQDFIQLHDALSELLEKKLAQTQMAA